MLHIVKALHNRGRTHWLSRSVTDCSDDRAGTSLTQSLHQCLFTAGQRWVKTRSKDKPWLKISAFLRPNASIAKVTRSWLTKVLQRHPAIHPFNIDLQQLWYKKGNYIQYIFQTSITCLGMEIFNDNSLIAALYCQGLTCNCHHLPVEGPLRFSFAALVKQEAQPPFWRSTIYCHQYLSATLFDSISFT